MYSFSLSPWHSVYELHCTHFHPPTAHSTFTSWLLVSLLVTILEVNAQFLLETSRLNLLYVKSLETL